MKSTLSLTRLDGVRSTRTGWLARCAAHEDQNPSLSIRFGDDGRILLHCFAGCPVEAVCAALGLSVRDLFPSQGRNDRNTLQSRVRLAVERAVQRPFEAACNDVYRRLAFLYRFVNRQLLDGFEAYVELAPLVHDLPWLEFIMDSLFDRDAETRALREGLPLCRELAL